MIRRCVVCGAEFEVAPSTNKITCSKDCSRIRKSAAHKGKRNKWADEKRDSARQAAAKTGNLKSGTAAALQLPEGQRGPQNRGAKIWHLRDPDGNPVVAVNLLDWARHHTEDFGMEPTEQSAVKIASGIQQIKRSMEGKIRRNGRPYTVTSYKGWELMSWEEK